MPPYDFFQESPANVQYGADPGYGAGACFAEPKDFLSLKDVMTPAVNEGDTLRITASHTFTSPDGFVKLTGHQDGIELEGDAPGDPGFKVDIMHKLKIFLVGDKVALREKVKNIRNRGIILLFPDPDCQTARTLQLGCGCDPAICVEAKYTSGNRKSGGKKGYELVFQSICLLDYEGTITYKA